MIFASESLCIRKIVIMYEWWHDEHRWEGKLSASHMVDIILKLMTLILEWWEGNKRSEGE